MAGDPVPVLDNVRGFASGAAQFSVSGTGTLQDLRLLPTKGTAR
jgi:hypothetical protein